MWLCSFGWPKEPKATARRKSGVRALAGLKRAPKAVLQAKRPRFSAGPGVVLFPRWKVGCKVVGKLFAFFLRPRGRPPASPPCFPDFHKAGDFVSKGEWKIFYHHSGPTLSRLVLSSRLYKSGNLSFPRGQGGFLLRVESWAATKSRPVSLSRPDGLVCGRGSGGRDEALAGKIPPEIRWRC